MSTLRPRALVLAAATAAAAVVLAVAPAFPAGTPPPEAEASSGFPPGLLGALLTAEVTALRGDETDAARAARRYIEAARRHRDPALARRAASMAAGVERFGLAAEACAEWRRLEPGNRLARPMHALMLARADRSEEAVAMLRGIAKEWDDPGQTGHEVVVEVVRQDPDAVRRVRIMEAVAGDGRESRFALARVLAGSGEGDRALKVLEVLRRETPADHRYALAQALLLLGRDERDAALEALTGLEAESDGGDDLLRTRARLLTSAGRREEAHVQYETLIERRPDDLDARWELARLLTAMERFDAALPHFRELYRWPGWRDGAWYFTGLIDEERADPDRALRAYRKVRDGSYYLSARIRSAEIMADRGELRWARWHLAATPRYTRGDDVRLYRAESGLLLRADRPAEAITVLDAALYTYPEHDDLLYARAMVAERLDRLDILERDLRAIIARDPNHAEALNALGYTLADRTDRYEEALALVERALALEPDEYHIVDSMGWVLYRLGRHEEAAEHLRRSYEGEPDPVVAAHLGEVLWVLGRHEEAREIWDSALDDSPDNEVLLETIERLGS